MSKIQFNSGHILPDDSILSIEPICKLVIHRDLDTNLGINSVNDPYINLKDTISVVIDWKASYIDAADKVVCMSVDRKTVEVGSNSQSLSEFINNPENIKNFDFDEVALRYFNRNIERFMLIHTMIMNSATSSMIPDDVDTLIDNRPAPTTDELQADLMKKLHRFTNVLGERYHDGEKWQDGYNVIGDIPVKDKKQIVGFLELSSVLEEIDVTLTPENLAFMMEVPYITLV